jgi:NAD dependent epimerase/dehydratase family enzyme
MIEALPANLFFNTKIKRVDREKMDLWVKVNGKTIYRRNYSSEEKWRFAVKRLSSVKNK